MLNKLKEMRETGSEEGFTLIELMIVVVIIGILAAIAIPIFANQQKSAISAGLKSDVKNTNTNIATALVKSPTATGFTQNATTVTLDTGVTAAKVISDSGTTINIGQSSGTSPAWNTYTVVGTNAAADPGTVTYSVASGKLS